MKTRIGELNGRPLVICSDEHDVRYPELLVITDVTGEKISDIKERLGEDIKSIIITPKPVVPENPPEEGKEEEEEVEDDGSEKIINLINKLGL